jgi:uncharacterized protein (DUF2235 family)
MKNIVLCFDHDPVGLPETNARAIFNLLDDTEPKRQHTWYDPGFGTLSFADSWAQVIQRVRQGRNASFDGPQDSMVDAYMFLVESWEPGDRIFLFGVGRGAYCARALARLLGTVGVIRRDSDELLEYMVSTYALPRSHRTLEEWQRVARLASDLSDEPDGDVSVPVHFLGLWDTLKVPGPGRSSALAVDMDPLRNVVSGRHAVAIDGNRGSFGEHLVSPAAAERIEEVWFRGSHADVVGGMGGQGELADITLDWMLDGALRAGLVLRADAGDDIPSPTELHALAETPRPAATRFLTGTRFRRLPEEALVHASVEYYVHEHPEYWLRLPASLVWADVDWPARSERLVHRADVTVISGSVESTKLTAAAS